MEHGVWILLFYSGCAFTFVRLGVYEGVVMITCWCRGVVCLWSVSFVCWLWAHLVRVVDYGLFLGFGVSAYFLWCLFSRFVSITLLDWLLWFGWNNVGEHCLLLCIDLLRGSY